MSITGTYAPEEGKEEESEKFYNLLQKHIQANSKDHILLAGDLNARIGKEPIKNLIGIHGEEHLNNNGRQLRELVTMNSLKITNTFFKKRDINKFTWAARGYRSIIGYIIVNHTLAPRVMDTQVYRGRSVNTDHFLVKSKIQLWARWRKQMPK